MPVHRTGPSSILALANTGNAHGSYWLSTKVAEKIAEALLVSTRQSSQSKNINQARDNML
ncbi:hypothetical protein [Dictyobacter alpinus]|uniref:hypothetical protein n=1 Tax=Dictyobacter alpinus TaxID=2014873 RepID=UPI000F831FAC|nr:hypothetical protein [Dictyobacter alpinus]